MEREESDTDSKTSWISKKNNLLLAGIGLLVIVLVSLSVWIFVFRDTGPIPKQYRKGLDFSLYYPARLPEGYSVDRKSFKREGDVLIFSISAPRNRNIAVSQQIIPVDVPVHETKKTPIAIPGEKVFNVPAGSAQLGFWGEKYVSDIITDETWIILNVTGFTEDEATLIAQSFRAL